MPGADRETLALEDALVLRAESRHRPALKALRPMLATARRRADWPAVGFLLWAIAGSLWLFPLLTDNADEGAYLSQSTALRAGQLFPDAPAHPGAYHPWFSAISELLQFLFGENDQNSTRVR